MMVYINNNRGHRIRIRNTQFIYPPVREIMMKMAEESMVVREVLHMNEGEGPKSYAMNSSIQRKILATAKPIVEEAFRDQYFSNSNERGKRDGKHCPKVFKVADLGCASGPNSLAMLTHVANMVSDKCKEFDDLPEFQIFLNDLPGNDFNTVFRSLPTNVISDKQMFIAAVPGSFYERLFLSKSIDFFHSSSSLHWLSQVPPELIGKDGKCLNKGKSFISKESPEIVLSAYHTQFQRDFSSFLRHRGVEAADDARMVVVLLGRRSRDPSAEECCFDWNLLTKVLMEMAMEGLVEKEKIDSFNAPCYCPSIEEVEEEVEKEGSFSIKHIGIFDVNVEEDEDGECLRGHKMTRWMQATAESMIAAHFGEHIIQPLFVRYRKLINKYFINKKAILPNVVVSLKKKNT